jgi:CDP-diacylglycerol pyrophosphatase
MYLVSTPPKSTPIKVTNANPKEAPRKTSQGAFDWETSEKTANCVLSPNSARKIVQKEKNKTFQFTLSLTFTISVQRLPALVDSSGLERLLI